jgi:hypothetical protein
MLDECSLKRVKIASGQNLTLGERFAMSVGHERPQLSASKRLALGYQVSDFDH